MSRVKWGFINHAGEWIIPPKYEHAMPHSCGRAPVKTGGLYGYIDIEGNFIIPPEFKDFGIYHCDRCLVKRNGKNICIDQVGHVVFELTYKSALTYSEGLASVRDPENANAGYGYINIDGTIVLPFRYFLGYEFSECRVIIADRIGSFWYIDKYGSQVAGPFLDANMFKEGIAAVRERVWKFIDTRGEVKYSLPSNIFPTFFSGGMCGIEDINSNRRGYINSKFDLNIGCMYEYAWPFKDGVASVKVNGKSGLINAHGNIVCDYIYDDINMSSEGKSAFQRNGLWGFLDSHGEEVISPMYSICHDYQSGLAAVAVDTNTRGGNVW